MDTKIKIKIKQTEYRINKYNSMFNNININKIHKYKTNKFQSQRKERIKQQIKNLNDRLDMYLKLLK